MGLLDSLFKKKDSCKPTQEEVIAYSNQLVNEFAEFLQSPSYPAPGCIADTNRLPYSKPLLKGAFQIMLRAVNEKSHLQALSDCYACLADFQDGVGDADVGLETLSCESGENYTKVAQKILDDLSSVKSFEVVRQTEVQEILQDIRRILTAKLN